MGNLRSRWIILFLSTVLILIVAMALPAGAVKPTDPEKAQNLSWYAVTGGSSNNVTATPIPGHVMLNTPSGEVTMILNGEITLLPSTTYGVWIRQFTGYTGDYLTSYLPLWYYKLGTFTTDANGVGSFHFNISASDLAPDTRNIQIAINPSLFDTYVGSTVAATVKYTSITSG
jgi:hypothetical protein